MSFARTVKDEVVKIRTDKQEQLAELVCFIAPEYRHPFNQ